MRFLTNFEASIPWAQKLLLFRKFDQCVFSVLLMTVLIMLVVIETSCLNSTWSYWIQLWSSFFRCCYYRVMQPNNKSQKTARCLKITEKVSFNIASEVSAQKWIKNYPFWRVFENLKLAVKQCYETGQFNRTKIGGKCQISKIKMRHFE